MRQGLDRNFDRLSFFDQYALKSAGFTQIPEHCCLYSGFNEKIPSLSDQDSLYVSVAGYENTGMARYYRGQLRLVTRNGFTAVQMNPAASRFSEYFGSSSKGPHRYYLDSLTEWADERGVDAIHMLRDQFIVFDPSAVLRVEAVDEFVSITLDEAV